MWTLGSRATLPVEEWNAQISLLTGMCAARLMLDGGIGILRTLPDADPRDVARAAPLRARAGRAVARRRDAGDVIRDLDAANPAHAALLTDATSLLRGAAYVAFDGEVRAHDARGDRRALRPHDRTAAPAGGPVRRRDVPRPVRRPPGARTGSATRCRSCPD